MANRHLLDSLRPGEIILKRDEMSRNNICRIECQVRPVPA